MSHGTGKPRIKPRRPTVKIVAAIRVRASHLASSASQFGRRHHRSQALRPLGRSGLSADANRRRAAHGRRQRRGRGRRRAVRSSIKPSRTQRPTAAAATPASSNKNCKAARAAADAAQASVEQLRRQLSRAVIVGARRRHRRQRERQSGRISHRPSAFHHRADRVACMRVLPSSSAQVVQIQQGAPATIVAANSTRRESGNVVAVLDRSRNPARPTSPSRSLFPTRTIICMPAFR